MSTRKAAILREATRLFTLKGYDAASVAEIARAADMSEGNIFKHFKNKEDLLFQIFRSIRREFLEEIEDHFSFTDHATGLDMLVELVRMFCHFYEIREMEFDLIHRNNPYQMPAIGEPCRAEIDRIHRKMIDLVKTAVRFGVTDKTIREVDIHRMSYLVIGMLTGAVRMRLYGDTHIRDVEDQLVDFCRAALESGHDQKVSRPGPVARLGRE